MNGISRAVLVWTSAVLFALALGGGTAAGGGAKRLTNLSPPDPLPAGAAENGHGRAEVEVEAGKRIRLKVDADDVEVIGDAGDAEFCNGFYLVVLRGDTGEVALPAFGGFIVTCDVAGKPQGPTRGFINFEVRLDKGQSWIDPKGMTMELWEVEPVRDAAGKAAKGPNGEPFIVASRNFIALEGVLN